jgi:hypothetical protein
MFHAVPFLISLFVFITGLCFSLRCAEFQYNYDSALQPYSDRGFQILPDWSPAASWLPPLVGGVHAALTVVLFTLQSRPAVAPVSTVSLVLPQ